MNGRTECFEKLQKDYFATDLILYNRNPESPLYPTDHGWMGFEDSVDIITDTFTVNSLHQLTVEFEYLPLANKHYLSVYPYASGNKWWDQYS